MEASFIKEFPEYGRVRQFFFGLVTVRSWGYRCVLTMPQIELMQADLPHTLYHSNNEKQTTQSDIDEAERLTREAMERKRKMREQKAQEEGYTIDEIFNGASDKEVATKKE